MTARRRIGKYEIAEQVGVGGFGIVYKAWDPYIQRWVALKTCSTTSEEATQRFFREAQLAGALQHPNITLVYDFGIENGEPFFVQEFLSGTDLDHLVKRGQLSIEGTLAILVQVCAGLEFAHSRGIIHRDIKPANVRVLEDGSIKIMDFGIAKSLQAESNLTQAGVALGTAGYLAPEQLADRPLDARTDIFSLGVMGYEMITGARPFAGPNLSNVVYQILNQDPVPPRQRNPQCPERLERAVLKALAKNPEQRFASVRELGYELREVLMFLPNRGTARRLESTTSSMIRLELSRLAAQPPRELTSATQLAVQPLQQAPTEIAPTQPTAKRRTRLPLALGAAGGLLALAALALAWYQGRPDSAPRAGTAAGTPAIAPSPAPSTPDPAVAPAVPTQAPAPLPVAVEIFADPPAEVEVDGQSLGRLQTRQLVLAPGSHVFRQRIPGYREKTVTVDVSAQTGRITLQLPPFGLLSVFNDFDVPMRDTKVLVDGKEIGALPITDRKVEAGRRELVVRWPDGSEFREEIEIPAEAPIRRVVRPALLAP
ncbi:MAG: protein kinase [Acidobacteriota bacterium]